MRFIICLLICFLSTVIDVFASVIFDYLPVSVWLFYFLQTLYHLTDVLIILAWFLYAASVTLENKPHLLKIFDLISICFYAAYALVIICNCFGGYIFTYSESAGYARGSAFLFPVGVFGTTATITCILAIAYRKHVSDTYIRHTLMLIPLLLSLGIVLQLCIDGWLMICPMYSIGLLVAFLTIQRNNNRLVIDDLSEIAYRDALTGVGNREFAFTQIGGYLEKNLGCECTLILLDLDNLKNINDGFGHAAGDRVLHRLGKLLNSYFSGEEVVARFGGDEFVIFLPGKHTVEELSIKLSKLVLDVSQLDVSSKENIPVSCSAGAVISIGSETFNTLLRRADIALYTVKRGGKNDFAFFNSDMEEMEYAHSRVDSIATRHVDWFNSNELKQLLYALSEYFPYVVSINLTQNNYYAMETDPKMSDNFPVYGKYDDFVLTSSSVFDDEDCPLIMQTFSRQSLIDAYNGNEDNVSLVVNHDTPKGRCWNQICCRFGRRQEGEDLRAYIIVRPYNAEHKAENEHMGLMKIFELAVNTVFQYISTVHTETGEYQLFGNDGNNSHNVPEFGNYDEIVETVTKLVDENEQQAFEENARLETVIKRIKENGGEYKYTYHALGHTWETAFYYYEPSNNRLLMTLREL